ncbi:MAG: NUDIX domain-containing protein [Candidatus Doudnabacteria bacterium]|nr:NUDIX domain-containing protein [Candidatus Doudnabacteria bacterium]
MKSGVDHIGVCVVYFCHDGKGRVLMARRTENSRDEHGRWDIGGGRIEFGDTVENTLRKEIQEEYNAKVLDFEFLGFRDVHRSHNGEPTHWLALDYKVLIDPEGIKINEPHKFDSLDWFTIDNLPQPVHSQFPEFLEKYRKKL